MVRSRFLVLALAFAALGSGIVTPRPAHADPLDAFIGTILRAICIPTMVDDGDRILTGYDCTHDYRNHRKD